MTDARLEELYRLSLASRDGGDREGCVSPEAILALVRREGPEAGRAATLDHVMSCEACRREFDLLRSIELAGAEAGGVPAMRRPAGRAWRRVAPLAVAAALLVAVGLGVRDRGRAPVDVVRGTSDGVALLAPDSEVAVAAPIVFAWRPDPGAGSYRLEVMAGGRVVVSETTTDTTFTLRDVSRLAPGSAYRWWVRAVAPGGAQRGSELRSLRLRSR